MSKQLSPVQGVFSAYGFGLLGLVFDTLNRKP